MKLRDLILAKLSVHEAATAAGVKLTKFGQDWRGCCPFHQEKTPSMVVYDDHAKGFCCFGCQASGSVIDFVMRLRKQPARRVMTDLAAELGITERGSQLLRQTRYDDTPAPGPEEAELNRHHLVAERARRIWAAAIPVTSHPYLTRKGVVSYGLREYRGLLVVPMEIGGRVVSLQFINEDGGKKYLRGGQTKGAYFMIGGV